MLLSSESSTSSYSYAPPPSFDGPFVLLLIVHRFLTYTVEWQLRHIMSSWFCFQILQLVHIIETLFSSECGVQVEQVGVAFFNGLKGHLVAYCLVKAQHSVQKTGQSNDFLSWHDAPQPLVSFFSPLNLQACSLRFLLYMQEMLLPWVFNDFNLAGMRA